MVKLGTGLGDKSRPKRKVLIIMKKAFLLLLGAALCVCACAPESMPDASLEGTKVDVSVFPESIRKVFVLNEGGMGSNNASLDLLQVSGGTYVNGVFKKMNPEEGAGLGDVGNDIVVNGNEVWIAVCNSGIVEVLDAKSEKQIAAITVPTPRSIAFDNKYAYVSSWAGAYVNGSYDAEGNYTITDSKNPKGQVYRIDLKTKKVEGSVEVGYQPEGIACYGGKVYVANSGGLSCQLPPDYAYDKTVNVIDTKKFEVELTLDVQVNLEKVYSDGNGRIYVTTLGNYGDVHSGLYVIDSEYKVSKVADYVSKSCISGDTVYFVGAENEFDWNAPKEFFTRSCKAGTVSYLSLQPDAKTPYGICAIAEDTFLIADAGDYFNPGSVSLYHDGTKIWTVDAGVCPGHFAIW